MAYHSFLFHGYSHPGYDSFLPLQERIGPLASNAGKFTGAALAENYSFWPGRLVPEKKRYGVGESTRRAWLAKPQKPFLP